ncbi:MAG: tetratricopeptide repeat protein, partial [Candidatus Marinimicrobia bacterium]|nr:tetratricopeptide repeat protein [Candidatus Neomarinimicrobiota bacterium]
INAIMEYQKESHYAPTDVTVLTQIAHCYRHLGDYSKAKKFLENTLSILPMYAEAHYELARVYANDNDLVNARKHMDIVQTIWENADPEYPPARSAKRFYESIITRRPS